MAENHAGNHAGDHAGHCDGHHAAGHAALRVMAMALATAALLGCATQARHQQAALDELKAALPGEYDNAGQQSQGPRAAPVLPVMLSIVTAPAQLIGDNVFFVRETAADNARLVLSQSVWTLTFEPKQARIVQRSYLLKDPRRWLGAAQNPDLLVSMLPQDLRPLPSCDLVWTQTATGFETTGAPALPRARAASARGAHARTAATSATTSATGASGCRPGPQAQGIWIEQSAQLNGRQLTLTERRTAADGALERSGAPLSLVLQRGASAAAGSASSSASPGTVPAALPPAQ
ncbi:MAG: CpcT/CpeT family chromophore lyase [Steroidobacteraceae bacterium]